MTRYVKQVGSLLGEHACIFSCHEYLGKNILELPGITLGSDQLVKLLHHLGRVVLGGGIDGEHT